MAAKATLDKTQDSPELEIIEAEDSASIKKREKEARKREKRNMKANKKGGKVWIVVLIIVAVLFAMVAIVGFNFLNIRDNYLSGVIKNIPIVKNLIGDENSNDPLANLTKEQLNQQIAALEMQLSKKDDEIEQVTEKYSGILKEVESLRPLAEEKTLFNATKETFYQEAALKDPIAYQKYFEFINQDLANELYAQVVGVNVRTKTMKTYIETYTLMDSKKAAKSFEELIKSDMEIVVDILNAMDSAHRADILADMTPVNSAALTKQLKPVEQEPVIVPSATETPIG